jgi:anthranilate/para-aminobenzoate synthase component I
MERFVRWDRAEHSLSTQPIKGTVARGTRADAELAAALRVDPKEHAEHVMIVDLMRNDLSRVAETGSVCVSAPLCVEPYARLLHLVSTVTCRTRPEVTLADVLRATFPPGSVTGAPKHAAIDLIEQLEAGPRGVYTGALGFIDRLGGLSLAVAIRTAVIEAGELEYWTGGGIVAASSVQAELDETLLKAAVLRDALRALEQSARLGSCSLLR